MNDNFDTKLQKAFDFSIDATKQLITVATGITTFTVTFSKDFVGNASDTVKWIAVVAWICYFMSILFGVITLYTLTGQLEPGGDPANEKKPSIWAKAVNIPMATQWISFLVGLAVTLIFSALSMLSPKPPTPHEQYEVVIPTAVLTTTTNALTSPKSTTFVVRSKK